jgi:hypothetical protein
LLSRSLNRFLNATSIRYIWSLSQYALLLHVSIVKSSTGRSSSSRRSTSLRQLMVFVIHLAKRLARSFQGVNRIQVLGELVVQVVVLNLHDRSLSLIPAGPMRDQTMRL